MTTRITVAKAASSTDIAAAPAGAQAKALAVLRIATGLVFLWAFLDKLFGLGYATPSAKAWIAGGSPTKGFLSSVDVGPFDTAFHAIAGAWWADWPFMLGLAGVGIAATLGVALRPSAVAGSAMLLLMWLAEFPLDRLAADGSPSMSSNPLIDYHVIYAIALIVGALTYAGNTWGLGRWWAALPFVRRHQWAI
ncbi:MAG: thiosulfate dehydrogenase (quinone) large subunit [Pseudonocardiales bacterium]|jgi:thiosulfate dehydrogenase [quinone] large subunit|nr:thiosulfate dehydrogenase (quinone) large subunit [Pseudonocardiales bacterium]